MPENTGCGCEPAGSLAFTAHQSDVAAVRREIWGEREWIVLPVVPIRAGVLNGELVPAEELAIGPGSWNGRPVTIEHPQEGGEYISANCPEVLDQSGVGYLFNTDYVGDRLQGEIWLDVARVRGHVQGDLVLEAIDAGEPIEVSTGYWRLAEAREGMHGGRRYYSVAHDIKPDHLALILSGVGACSWRDGCGAPRINEEEASMEGHEDEAGRGAGEERRGPSWLRVLASTIARLAGHEEALDERVRRIRDAFYSQGAQPQQYDDRYVQHVFDGYVIVESPDGLMRYDYSENEEGGVEFGEPMAVEVVYQVVEEGGGDEPAVNEAPPAGQGHEPAGEAPEVPPADPQEVDIVNRELVSKVVGRLGLTINADTAEADELLQALAEYQPAEPCDGLRELQGMIDDLGGLEATRAAVDEVIANAAARRDELVSGLVANGRCAFEEEELQEMGLDALEKLAKSLKVQNYGGTPARSQGVTEEQEYRLPPMGI